MARTVVSRKDFKTYGKKTKRFYTSHEIRPKAGRDKPVLAPAPKGYGVPAPEVYRAKYRDNIDSDKVKSDPKAVEPDKYTSRLLKYIPAEVIALYLTLDIIIRSAEQTPLGIYWFVFLFGIAATFFYLRRVEKVYKNSQIIISVIAYCVWVFAIGGPFVYLNWYQPLYGAIILPMYTFIVPIIEA